MSIYSYFLLVQHIFDELWIYKLRNKKLMKNDLVTYFQISMPNLTTIWNIFTKDVNTDKFECLIEIFQSQKFNFNHCTFTSQSWMLHFRSLIRILNHLHPNISMHIPLNIFYTFPNVLKRRICFTIKSFSSWFNHFLYSHDLNLWFWGDMVLGKIRCLSLLGNQRVKQRHFW